MCDEAQELTDEQMAALMPVISAGSNQNPQTVLIGTPPPPGCMADVFRNTRRTALSDSPGAICWHEWSVDELGDVADWSRIEATNPAIDVRLMRSAVEAELGAMSPEYFARERLGWWSNGGVQSVIPAKEWDACAGEPPSDGIKSYAVKFSTDGRLVSVSACLKPRDGGKPFVEGVFHSTLESGVMWLVEWLSKRKQTAACIVIDGRGSADAMAERLRGIGVQPSIIRIPTAREAATANAALLDAVREGRFAHSAQPDLDKAAKSCPKRPIGNAGGWGFASIDDADATLIESAALALWGSRQTRRDPERKARFKW